MVNDVIDGISNALYENFEGVEIRSEGIEQGYVEPSFFIECVSTTEIPLLGDRAYRSMLFDVHYFPSSEHEENKELQTVASMLYKVLRRITLLDGDMLNGLRLNHKITDGVLHFFVEYKPTIFYVGDKPSMQEDLRYKVGVE